MPADTPQPDEHRDPLDGTAAIAPVTDAMMEHAAHEAAALADGVAHGTIEVQKEAKTVSGAAAPAAEAPVREAAETAERAADAAAGAARDAVEAAGTLTHDAARRTAALAETGAADVDRAAEQAQSALSASADAIAQYNAKVFEMMRDSAASATALFAALVQAKSVPEALSINADHMRRRMEALTSQGRELANLAQSVVLDALQPPKNRP